MDFNCGTLKECHFINISCQNCECFLYFLFSLFFFSFLFYLFFNLGFRVRVSCDVTWSHNTEKALEEIMLYSMATTYWSYRKHIYFRIG